MKPSTSERELHANLQETGRKSYEPVPDTHLTAGTVTSTSPGRSAYSITRSTLFMFISSSVPMRTSRFISCVMLLTDVRTSPASPAPGHK